MGGVGIERVGGDHANAGMFPVVGGRHITVGVLMSIIVRVGVWSGVRHCDFRNLICLRVRELYIVGLYLRIVVVTTLMLTTIIPFKMVVLAIFMRLNNRRGAVIGKFSIVDVKRQLLKGNSKIQIVKRGFDILKSQSQTLVITLLLAYILTSSRVSQITCIRINTHT